MKPDDKNLTQQGITGKTDKQTAITGSGAGSGQAEFSTNTKSDIVEATEVSSS